MDSRTGELLWGSGARLLSPRDGASALALPLANPETGQSSDAIVPGEVIREIRLGPVRKPVYGPWIEAMVAAGYELGDLSQPRAEETLFVFAYDWRADSVDNARKLAAAMERLRKSRGGTLDVDLVCQSNGGYLCRWLAKFGGGTLEQAEAGTAPPLESVRFAHMVLVGTANGGSLRILRLMHEGRKYVPVFGRRIDPETLFSFPALFQDLPYFARDLFIDGREQLSLDLFEVDNWQEFGWSVFAAQKKRASSQRGERRLAQARHLEFQLDRAQRLHRLLLSDPEVLPVGRVVLVQSRTTATDRRARVFRKRGRWQLEFGDERRPAGQLFEPGDGHATTSSQLWLSDQELARLEGEVPILLDARHFEMILHPLALQAVETLLGRSDATLQSLEER